MSNNSIYQNIINVRSFFIRTFNNLSAILNDSAGVRKVKALHWNAVNSVLHIYNTIVLDMIKVSGLRIIITKSFNTMCYLTFFLVFLPIILRHDIKYKNMSEYQDTCLLVDGGHFHSHCHR